MTVLVRTGELTQAEIDFQDKMKERMRQAFGDLMPDAVLSGIVARGIEEAFFAKQIIPKRNSWDRDQELPSWLVQFVKIEAEAQVKVAVEKWIIENKEKFTEVVADTLAGGLATAVVRAFNVVFASAFSDLESKIQEIARKFQ